jgi:hypothetical protein
MFCVFQNVWFLLSLDDEATALLRNVENSPVTKSQPTNTEISAKPLSEPQVACRCGGVAVGRGGGVASPGSRVKGGAANWAVK